MFKLLIDIIGWKVDEIWFHQCRTELQLGTKFQLEYFQSCSQSVSWIQRTKKPVIKALQQNFWQTPSVRKQV